MLALLDKLSLPLVALVALFLGLAPFFPEPHIVEKLRMLGQGALTGPIDIFDLVYHLAPIALLVAKLWRIRQLNRA